MKFFYRDPQGHVHELDELEDSLAVPNFILAIRLTDHVQIHLHRNEIFDEFGHPIYGQKRSEL